MATQKSTDFIPLRNKQRQYQHKKTGEIISRRQWLKIKSGAKSLEQLAKQNKARNEQLAFLRPARGRKSALKATPTEQKIIAEARKEDFERRQQLAQAEREAKLLDRKIEKARKKRVHRKVIRPQLLKTGSKGARISLNNYEDYLAAFNEGKRATVAVSGKRVPLLFSYGLGMVGVNEDTGEDLGITVFTMKAFDKPISLDDFYDAMDATLEERPYFIFSHYFMHLAFNINYARQRAGRKR